LDAAFAARRTAKQQLLGGRAIDGDTEVLAWAAATPSGSPHSRSAIDEPEASRRGRPETPARPRWLRRSWRPALLAVLLLPGLALSNSWLQRQAGSGALHRPCLLVETSGPLANGDAVWLAVRLVGLALDGHPTLHVMHGYRVQDREGWNPTGQAAAERACVTSGADGVVVISAQPSGHVRATQNGQLVTKQVASSLAGIAELAEGLAARWAPLPADAPPWRATLPEWPDGSLRALLDLREGLVLQRPGDNASKQRFEALVRENPQLEFVYLVEAITRWWNGDLDDPAARAAIPRPPGASHRTEVLIGAIADLAGGHEASADVAVARLLEDTRWASDPITLYIAGEARIHAGRQAEGTRLLERALAVDPQLTPAIYHVVERRLAEGDWAAVERIAALWDRVEPGSPRAIELRGAILLGTGRYDDASRSFESLLDRSRSDTASLHLPRAALIYARLLAGDVVGALARARVASSRMDDYPALTSVLPDPIVYGWALGRGDQALASEWEVHLRQRLAGKTESANYWQLAYSLAILDHLAGRTDARARWVGAGPSASVSRRYRFAPHARMLAVLEAHAADDWNALAEAARDERDLPAFHLARAQLALSDGRATDAVRELESAMATSPNGDFDCVTAALLARTQKAAGDTTGAAATCRRIMIPRVPRPFCLVARRDCLAATPP
ncbi:MAG TPA: hypothetical protein VIX73_29375, partial [Kofleriaceae bacterium]